MGFFSKLFADSDPPRDVQLPNALPRGAFETPEPPPRVAHIDEHGNLAPLPKAETPPPPPRYSVLDLLAMLTLTPVNMALVLAISERVGERSPTAACLAGIMTLLWLAATHRNLRAVKRQEGTGRGSFALWSARSLPTVVMLGGLLLAGVADAPEQNPLPDLPDRHKWRFGLPDE